MLQRNEMVFVDVPGTKRAPSEGGLLPFADCGLFGRLLLRRGQRTRIVDFCDLVIAEAQNLAQDFIGMFTKQWRTEHFAWAVRQLDWIADRKILAANGMVDFHNGSGCSQRLVLGEFLHRQDRPAGDIELVKDVHGIELGLRHGPLLNAGENFVEPWQPGRGLRVIWMGFPAWLADHVSDLLPDRRLGNKVDVSVGIGLPAFALEDAAGLTSA